MTQGPTYIGPYTISQLPNFPHIASRATLICLLFLLRLRSALPVSLSTLQTDTGRPVNFIRGMVVNINNILVKTQKNIHCVLAKNTPGLKMMCAYCVCSVCVRETAAARCADRKLKPYKSVQITGSHTLKIMIL